MIKHKNEEYYTKQHSKFLLQYHLIFITKYRHPVIQGNLKERLIQYTLDYFKDRDLNVLELNTDKDHIHILFEAYPNLNLSSLVNAFKSSSSRHMRQEFKEELASYYWKPYFWSRSYFICTVSEKSLQYVQEYIQKQGLKESHSSHH